ncbi:hypothetical protein G9A89_001672 [Geosiphon pyriformis]|nr:hypothetical protein G9A89_001672 [Geosiphon pyriformis]
MASTKAKNYCDECDFLFNPLLRILYPIIKLPKSKKEYEFTIENMLFQELRETTEIEQYFAYLDLFKELELKWYSNNNKGICLKKEHKIDTGFDLRYPRQSSIIIVSHFFVKIPISIIVQVASWSNLTKKIDVKEEIINAGYIKNIIIMLQNNSNKSYKIKLQKKIAQAIFLFLLKILQLTLVIT